MAQESSQADPTLPPLVCWLSKYTTAPSLPVCLSFLPCIEDVAWTHSWEGTTGDTHPCV